VTDRAVDLSIIIVTYNAREITLQTLHSYRKALAADPDHRYELIVVDNASQDGIADAVAQALPEVRLIRNRDNVGFSAANNTGFEASVGRYILFSNPDIEVNEATLPTLIGLMDESPEVAACTPFLRLARTDEIDWGSHRGFPTPWAALTYFSGLERLFRHSKRMSALLGRYHLLDRDLSRPHEVDAIKGGFFWVRRDAFERAGRWDEDYFMYGEDLDLCFQIKKLNARIMFYPQAQAVHYHGMTTGLKRHSRDLSSADAEARAKAYHAFYDAMKIFYDKNYRERYPLWLRRLILWAVEVKRYLGMRELTV
jgi:GT2 family glycosyltransferase